MRQSKRETLHVRVLEPLKRMVAMVTAVKPPFANHPKVAPSAVIFMATSHVAFLREVDLWMVLGANPVVGIFLSGIKMNSWWKDLESNCLVCTFYFYTFTHHRQTCFYCLWNFFNYKKTPHYILFLKWKARATLALILSNSFYTSSKQNRESTKGYSRWKVE